MPGVTGIEVVDVAVRIFEERQRAAPGLFRRRHLEFHPFAAEIRIIAVDVIDDKADPRVASHKTFVVRLGQAQTDRARLTDSGG